MQELHKGYELQVYIWLLFETIQFKDFLILNRKHFKHSDECYV